MNAPLADRMRPKTLDDVVGQPATVGEALQILGEHTEPDSPRWAVAGGWRTATLSWSLTLVMAAIFFASLAGSTTKVAEPSDTT